MSMSYRRRRTASSWMLLLPYAVLFLLIVVIPILAAAALSFTNFDTIQTPAFTGLNNYISLLTNDDVFMQYVLPNTIIFAVFVGAGGYILSFFLAWSLSQLTRVPRTILTIIIYSPSMTGGVLISTIWSVIFNGDKAGYLNALLLKLKQYLLPIMIIVSLWSSMGVGFLAMLAGVMNVDRELYEAAYIDGVRNRMQEILYVTIPSARPQLLFGAVMAIVNTFQTADIGVALSGSNPTPNYAGQLIVTHIQDFGFLRYEMGYAAAVSVVLLIGVNLMSKGANKLFGSEDEL